MALAILELVDYDDAGYRFRIDTGTNPYYQLKAGTGVRRELGVELVEEVYFSTPLAASENGGDLLGSAAEISLPADRLDRRNTWVQLFSFKSADRTSPAFSKAVRLPAGIDRPARGPSDYAALFSSSAGHAMNRIRTARRIPCRTAAFARPASMDEWIGSVLRVAAPLVQELLRGEASGLRGGGAAGPAAPGGSAAASGIIAQLLQAFLGGIPGLAGQAVSRPQSRNLARADGNRFKRSGGGYARPFIFGIDDALIASMLPSLIGPLVQVLPQLANAANQKRIQLKQADNNLVAGIVSDINKRLLLDQLAEAQRQAPPGGAVSPEALNQLAELLKQARPAAPAGAVAAPAAPQSLTPAGRAHTLSNRAVLSIVTADPVAWNGTQRALFARNRELVLRIRLAAGEPAPKSPLPKAILKVVLKESANPAVRFEKSFQRKNVFAGAVMECPFSAGELAHLPAHRPIAVVGELRWRNPKTGRESRALGSSEIVLVNKYFLLEQGEAAGDEVELRDMKQYRSFWNKVWEAPVLDAARTDSGGRKYMWELDVNARYAVVLTAEHDSNGRMETKLLRGAADPESLAERIEGRLKAGIELSVAEMNRLLPLWGEAAGLDAERLEAFGAPEFLDRNAGEFRYRFQLKGRAGQRGLIWVVPVFKLFRFKLGSVVRTDAHGQVLEAAGEETRFPLPVAGRVIGLKSVP